MDEHEHDHDHEAAHQHEAEQHDHEHGHEHHHAAGGHTHDIAAEYAAALGDFRRRRDRAFAEGDGSPLLPEDRTAFHGLRYYEPDLAYRLDGVRAEPYAGGEPATFAMPTSDGQVRQARRIATLRFELGGRPLALNAYGFDDSDEGELFVPFVDGTSGHQTYGAGRYLDLATEDDGTVVLDFNLAYHPLCVYSPYFSCPLPPAENRLPVRVEAGEMLPEGIGGH